MDRLGFPRTIYSGTGLTSTRIVKEGQGAAFSGSHVVKKQDRRIFRYARKKRPPEAGPRRADST
jgi:hypothetical protein